MPGGIDISQLGPYLLANGPLGAIVLWLLFDRQKMADRLETAQLTYHDKLLKIVEEVTKAIGASTDAMRTNTTAQERTVESGRAIAEALRLLQATIGALEKDVEDLRRHDREGR